jgi:XTP/dITP diphosphohydrolase
MACLLLLATNNPGKVKEYRSLLTGTGLDLVTLRQARIDTVVEETGQTFEENARAKAVTMAAESGLITLADDSGLEVDVLGGEPGLHSARYAGDNASDQERVEYLLKKLSGIPWEKRSARFRCIIALATPTGAVEFCHGECAGMITFEPKGTSGFGYDPIFYFPSLGKTMAELPLDEKNRISHRAQAARKVWGVLVRPPFECNLPSDR